MRSAYSQRCSSTKSIELFFTLGSTARAKKKLSNVTMSHLQWVGTRLCLCIDIGTLIQEQSRDLNVADGG